jgi:hypothetical protein
MLIDKVNKFYAYHITIIMEFEFLNGEESKCVSITKIVLQVIFYMYKNRYKFWSKITIYF